MAMVAAGMGICFLPEYSATHPGICHRVVADPEVVREVSLVSVNGRSLSPPAAAFVEAVHAYDWSGRSAVTVAPRRPRVHLASSR
jgi:DNA-binding transcriptional LysR family regulator